MDIISDRIITAPVGEFCALSGLGRSKVYELIGDGSLESFTLGKRRLIVIPDGSLNTLPFDSLVTPTGQYLVQSAIITYSPSSTVFFLLRSLSQRSLPKRPFLGVSYDQDRPLLAQGGRLWARAAGILTVADPVRVTTPEASTVKTLCLPVSNRTLPNSPERISAS